MLASILTHRDGPRRDGIRVRTQRIPAAGELWETWISGGACDGYRQRYGSRSDAYEGHEWCVLLAMYGWPKQGQELTR